ncbi:MAG: flagellar biosynthetic protein FliO [Leptospiraceae bacterium]|nr:flagellar biosynthetic protein FliO [Leptospiraceae bacterium]MDW7976488.1 flagellar biosynthetic protein FliO [Leptospiraceae bacterium]
MKSKKNYVLLIFSLILIGNLYSQEVSKKDPQQELKEIEKSWMEEIQMQNPQRTLNPAPNENPQANVIFDETPTVAGLIFRFVFVLGIFGFFFYYLIKYLKKKHWIVGDTASPVQILGTIPLMSGKFLQIVDIAGQIVILGISENSIQLVQVVENSIVAEKIRLWYQDYQQKRRAYENQWKTFFRENFFQTFQLWHSQKNPQRSFYAELTNKKNDEITLKEFEELLRIQQDQLKRFKESEI